MRVRGEGGEPQPVVMPGGGPAGGRTCTALGERVGSSLLPSSLSFSLPPAAREAGVRGSWITAFGQRRRSDLRYPVSSSLDSTAIGGMTRCLPRGVYSLSTSSRTFVLRVPGSESAGCGGGLARPPTSSHTTWRTCRDTVKESEAGGERGDYGSAVPVRPNPRPLRDCLSLASLTQRGKH
jgi:hypothetical protein